MKAHLAGEEDKWDGKPVVFKHLMFVFVKILRRYIHKCSCWLELIKVKARLPLATQLMQCDGPNTTLLVNICETGPDPRDT